MNQKSTTSTPLARLQRSTLNRLPDNLRLPRYDIDELGKGILHFGCGAFHRAHQAMATQRAIEAEGREGLRWGIASASMVRPNTPEALRPQQGLYSLVERSA